MYVILALAVGLLALMAVPLEIAFAVRRQAEFGGDLTLRWLFGLVRVPLRSSAAAKERKAKRRRKKSKTRESRFDRRILTVLRSRALQEQALRFVARALHCLRLRDVTLRARLGLDDPADTGILWGVAGPAIAVLERRPGADVDLEISFQGACFDADAKGTVWIIPLQLASVIVMFVLSPSVLWAVGALSFGGRR